MSKKKWDDKGMKTPLARARGLGSAKTGSHHWFMQRVTAIALLPLVLWFIWSLMGLLDTGGADGAFIAAEAWLRDPLHSILMVFLVLAAFYHAILGARVVVEDYIHHEGLKTAKLIAQKLTLTALAVVCLFAIMKISLGS